ncbi:MAG: dihydropteroate synthase [Omnitrophica WOR_2 bacterium RBG_13_41_10]|nr:MAG: dihydropteroate synthase [Omnitrophica WOR_2 bacterium RBG_13_41_10]
MLQVLKVNHAQDLEKIMRQIKVDSYGIKIMVPKAVTHLVKINSLPCITANILKQEMLSLGADVAVSKDTLTGKIPRTDCLLMGSLSQFKRLREKLKKQPFGLSVLARDLSCVLGNYAKDKFALDLGRFKLTLGSSKTRIMGIVNLTPDSFSADGLYRVQSTEYRVQSVIAFVENMIHEGADIIDIGGESSRPGAKAVSLKEEISRTVPVIKALAKKIKVPISIDTHKPEVAKQALDNGAVIINDITSLRDKNMRRVVSRSKAAVVLMHMKGTPPAMQKNPAYQALMEDILEYLKRSIELALDAGIDKNKIIVDPGIGFGKTTEHNLEIIKNLNQFKVLGRPILVGVSRKSFIGKILNKPILERLHGTISACVLAAAGGAHILRVHDVKEVSEALRINNAVLNA